MLDGLLEEHQIHHLGSCHVIRVQVRLEELRQNGIVFDESVRGIPGSESLVAKMAKHRLVCRKQGLGVPIYSKDAPQELVEEPVEKVLDTHTVSER